MDMHNRKVDRLIGWFINFMYKSVTSGVNVNKTEKQKLLV